MQTNKKSRPAWNGNGSQEDQLGGLIETKDNLLADSLQAVTDCDWATPKICIERLIEVVELHHTCRDLQSRIAIATIKQEYGLLTVEEQDQLLNEGDQLKRAIKNWRTR